ncbi:MAG: transglycosylase family protein, partial [Acidimicrobiales bacterium]
MFPIPHHLTLGHAAVTLSTPARVRTYEAGHGLVVDGVVGNQVAQSVLGHPDAPVGPLTAAEARALGLPVPTPPTTTTTTEPVQVTPRPPATTTTDYRAPGVWACIARHESGDNWAADTGNGYYGG